ncbi:MAG: PQQ-binding-like beta-propeller repeat protein [Caldisericales bacterium]|nr:PQQ-binding-like beta-propeller repeat protein [Caldisericales bacterium]
MRFFAAFLALTAALYWPTFGGSPMHHNATSTSLWPKFSKSWESPLSDGSIRVSTPVCFENKIVLKYQELRKPFEFRVVCFDAIDGSLIWSFSDSVIPKPKKVVLPLHPKDFEGSPAIFRNMVYATSNDTVFCLSVSDGKFLWWKTFGNNCDIFYVSPLISGTVVPAVIVPVARRSISCIDAMTGRVVWESKNPFWATSPALCQDNSFLCPAPMNASGSMIANIPEEMNTSLGPIITVPDKNKALFLCRDGVFRLFSYNRFFSRWEFEWKCSVDGGSTYPRAACYFEGDFLLPGRENVARVDENGEMLWNLQFAKGSIMGCLVCGKKALVLSKGASSTISVIDTRDGFLYESMKLDGQPMTVPVQTGNGFVIVFAKQGLVCYKGSDLPKLDCKSVDEVEMSGDGTVLLEVSNTGGSWASFYARPEKDWAIIDKGIIRCSPGQKTTIPIKVLFQGKHYRETRIVLTSETQSKTVLFCATNISSKD